LPFVVCQLFCTFAAGMDNMNSSSVGFTAPYLPPVSWWQRWVDAGMPALSGDMLVGRHAGINRALIDSPNGPLTITIPLAKPSSPISPTAEDPTATADRPAHGAGGSRVFDIVMSPHGDWRHKHWHALESTYFNSPFFEYYYDDFHDIYQGDEQMLWQFNSRLIDLVAHLAGLDDPSAIAALHRRNLSRRGEPYYQVFAHRHPFVHDMSIVDLLFNMGPESIYWIA